MYFVLSLIFLCCWLINYCTVYEYDCKYRLKLVNLTFEFGSTSKTATSCTSQCWKSFLYKFRQLMIAFLVTSGKCKKGFLGSEWQIAPFYYVYVWTWNQTQQFGASGLELVLAFAPKSLIMLMPYCLHYLDFR